MSVRIRLRRDGAKKRPFYHLVAADSRRARNGRFIEQLGYYNPIVAAADEPKMLLKEDRIRYWLSVGAQPSETAAALLKKQGLLARTVPAQGKTSAAATGATTEAVTEAAADTTPAAAAADTVAADTAATSETADAAVAPVADDASTATAA